MKIQVSKEHYDFNQYVDEHRWNSYYHQIYETLKCKGKEVLLIGVGDHIVSDFLMKFGKNVTTFDFDKELNPDIVGSVTDIDKILTKKYDVIICCQVLEHIPFKEFDSIIEKLSCCFKEKFILSLPNCDTWLKFNIKVPKLKEINYLKPIRRFWDNKWDINVQGNGEHYWEIDSKNSEIEKVEKILQKYTNIEKKFVASFNTYHIFFILTNKKGV